MVRQLFCCIQKLVVRRWDQQYNNYIQEVRVICILWMQKEFSPIMADSWG